MPSGLDATGVVFNVMRFALHDGPGIRTTVFFKGCPLDCWWCHNPESQKLRPEPVYFEERCRHCNGCVEVCPHGAVTVHDGVLSTDTRLCTRCGTCVERCAADAREICGRVVTVRELLAEIDRDVIFFDDSGGGVTLSGGEPLAQPEFASALLKACRERRINTAIETCGYAHPEVFQRVTADADLVLFDLKTLDPAAHKQYTGVHHEAILRNLASLAASGRKAVVRIPVVPGVNDTEGDAREFARYLSGLGMRCVNLLPYHGMGAEKYRRLGISRRLEDRPDAPREAVERFAGPLRDAGLEIRIGG
jgi:pyruvate formate lyase activating enzyme